MGYAVALWESDRPHGDAFRDELGDAEPWRASHDRARSKASVRDRSDVRSSRDETAGSSVVGMAVPTWVAQALDAAVAFGRQMDASAVALVGSFARAEGRPDSDVDLIVLLTEPHSALLSSDWFELFGPGTSLVRAEDFGAVQERRLVTADGHEIEVCIGDPTWASIHPVDPGTAAVVRGGLEALYDPGHLLADLLAAVNG